MRTSPLACATRGSTLRRGIVSGLVLGLAVAVAAPTASADPVYPSANQVHDAKAAAGAKAGQVSAVQAQLRESTVQLTAIQNAAETAAEKYNGAQVLLAQRTLAAREAASKAASAAKDSSAASSKVGALAAQTYMQGGSLGGLEAFFDSGGPQQVLDRASGLAVLGTIRSQALQSATAAQSVAKVLVLEANRTRAQQLAAALGARTARNTAERLATAAQQQTQAIQRQQGVMLNQLASLQHTTVTLETQRQAGLAAEARRREEARIKAAMARKQAAAAAAAAAARRIEAAAAAAVAAEQQRRAAAAASAASSQRQRSHHSSSTVHRSVAVALAAPAVRHSSSRPQSSSRHQSSSQPQSSSQHQSSSRYQNPAPAHAYGVSAVLAYARAQVGKWYLWGGSGPNQFDCSGLTMMAWRQAGVYMDHYTGSQYDYGTHVSVHSLQPGDLVFFGPSVAGIHHVGLYVGGGTMIEAPHTGAQIRYGSIWRSDLIPEGVRP